MSSSHSAWEEAVLWLCSQPDQQDLVRACYYDDPLIEAAARYETGEEWKATLAILPPPGHALDIGAGRGISSYALAMAGWKVIALEPDAGSQLGAGAIRDLAAGARLSLEVAESIAEEMPFSDSTFDLVYVREVLHHARDLNLFCRQIARVLKPGGVFLACREHVISVRDDLDSFLGSHPLHFLYGGENAYLLNEYLSAIHTSGLKLRKVLGQYETPINWFPLTEEKWREAVQEPVRRRMGKFVADLIGAPHHPWSGMLNRGLAKLISRLGNSPGRLYTFLAYKPL